MSSKLKSIVLLSGVIQLLHFAVAVNVDISGDGQDMLTVCPGEVVSLTCSHSDVADGQTRWVVSGSDSCVRAVLHDASVIEDNCGPFPITNISDNTGSTLNSTIVIPATEELNGTMVTCRAGGGVTAPLAGNITLNVIKVSSMSDWVANVRSDGSVLQWDPLDMPYQSCVTGYTITLNEEAIYNTTTITSLSPAAGNLSYCQTHTVSITPLTLTGALSTATSNITVIDPDFRTPELSSAFTVLDNGELQLQVMVQEISLDVVPVRMYGYAQSGQDCIPNSPFNRRSAAIDFSEQSTGAVLSVCVQFRNNECTAVNYTTVTVPATMISVVQEMPVSDTSYTLELTPPLTAHPPQDLLILTTLTPSSPQDLPSQPFLSSLRDIITVTFTDLTPGVEYTYTVRVVLASDQSNDIVPQVTGQFTLQQLGVTPTAVAAFPTAVVAGVIGGVAFVLLLMIVFVIITIVIVKHRSTHYNISEPISKSPSGPLYEEVDLVVPASQGQNIQMKSNDAYGQVKPAHALPRNIELQSNEAYGQLTAQC